MPTTSSSYTTSTHQIPYQNGLMYAPQGGGSNPESDRINAANAAKDRGWVEKQRLWAEEDRAIRKSEARAARAERAERASREARGAREAKEERRRKEDKADREKSDAEDRARFEAQTRENERRSAHEYAFDPGGYYLHHAKGYSDIIPAHLKGNMLNAQRHMESANYHNITGFNPRQRHGNPSRNPADYGAPTMNDLAEYASGARSSMIHHDYLAQKHGYRVNYPRMGGGGGGGSRGRIGGSAPQKPNPVVKDGDAASQAADASWWFNAKMRAAQPKAPTTERMSAYNHTA